VCGYGGGRVAPPAQLRDGRQKAAQAAGAPRRGLSGLHHEAHITGEGQQPHPVVGALVPRGECLGNVQQSGGERLVALHREERVSGSGGGGLHGRLARTRRNVRQGGGQLRAELLEFEASEIDLLQTGIALDIDL
jgi:hypothetical protein